MAQPWWHCFPQWQNNGLWPMHLLRWWSQTNQFHRRCCGAFANRCNQFYCGCFGAFTIVKGHGPVAHCGKELVIALHSMLIPKVLCGKRLIILLSPVAILERVLTSPSLARGSFWASSTDASSLAYLPYFSLATYMLSLAYSMYLPLATYTPLPM